MPGPGRQAFRLLVAGALLLAYGPLPSAHGADSAAQRDVTTWQLGRYDGAQAALALQCPTCPVLLALACPVAGRGLLRLSLPGAAVANGRNGATKQVRIIIDDTIVWRRATTRHRTVAIDIPARSRDLDHGAPPDSGADDIFKRVMRFEPQIDLASDDRILDRALGASLERGGRMVINFYGQKTLISLDGAASVISTVRRMCQPKAARSAAHPQGRHCVWSLKLGCHPTRRAALEAGKNHSGAIVREMAEGYCLALTFDDLNRAKAQASRLNGVIERSCL